VLTDPAEKIINQGQRAVQDKINEHQHYLSIGVEEVIGERIGSDVLFDGDATAQSRRESGKSLQERIATQRGPNDFDESKVPDDYLAAMGRDPMGETEQGRLSRAVATAYDDPESLAPYSIGRDPSDEQVQPDRVTEWADRLLIERSSFEIPSDEILAELPSRELFALYEEARMLLGTNIARFHIQELAMNEQRVRQFEDMRDALDTDMQVAGAAQSALLQSKVLSASIKMEQVESELRKESLAAALLALRMEGN
jgi:hypothetical protein